MALIGCGGGSDTTVSKPGQPTTETAPRKESAPGVAGAENGNSAGASEDKRQRSDFRGGEKDIEEFGSEAGGSESEAVPAAERGYLSAIVHRNYGKACSLVSSILERQFQELVRGGGGDQRVTCLQVLPHILDASASRVAALQLSGEVRKVRVKGDRGFVIFHAPGARLFVFPLAREDGSWRVATITSSILAPSAATLGE